MAALLFVASTAVAEDPCALADEAWVPTAITPDLATTFVPRRMLVMKAFWQSGTDALLIEDPREVNAIFDLLAGNATFGHACGFHWSVVFEDASRRLVSQFHNEECQPYRMFDAEIQSLLQSYFARVKSAPTGFLLEVELDPRADPESIARLLERDGRRVFFLQHPDSKLPRLRVERKASGPVSREYGENERSVIEAKAREKVVAVIREFSARDGARVFEEPRSRMSSSGRGRYESAFQATIVFPLAFDESRLAPEDGEFERPASWVVTLVSPERFSRKLEETIRAASPYVLRVAAVPEESIE